MRIADRTFRFFVLAFLWLLPLQFLFAGYGVFGGGFDTHEAFGGGLLHLLTLLMTIAALVARRWRLAGLSFLLFALMVLQIGFVEIGREVEEPWISALHPFLAFCYWPYAYFLIWRAAPAGAADAGVDAAVTPATAD